MKERQITEEEALQLSEREEGHFFDRKSLGVSGSKVQKIAVAFGNADGGEFLIGIADDSDEPDPGARWKGAAKEEEFNPHRQALFELDPALELRQELLTCRGKPGHVLRVHIEKSSRVHRTSDNKVYQRVGAQSLPITDPQRIVELSYAKGTSSFEDQVVKGLRAEEVVDTAEIKTFLTGYSPRTDPLEYATNQHLLDPETWEPKAAAVLLFHPNPSSAMPRKCAVKIARYETREDDPERDHLKKQRTLEGPLYPLIHNSIAEITEIMSSIKIWTPDGLKNVRYPPEAIWEILVNALIHRDYSISDDVHVYLYDNRIEVLSPGKLPGYVTVENILEARYSRNPKIVRTLNWYKDPPNKDLGEGLNTAFQKMKEWKLKSPIICEEGNYVKVLIPHTSLASPSEAILKFLETNQTITNKQARELTGIRSENLVKIEFYKLRDEGLIERVPGLSGPRSAWRRRKG